MRLLKRTHDMPRDSFPFCLKYRTSNRRLTTLEMGKKDKKNLEHKVSRSPYKLPTVWLYQCLAIPVKEKGNSFHLRVSSDMPAICKNTQVCSNSHRWKYGFSSPSPKKDCSRIIFIKHRRSSEPSVRIGFEDFGGSRRALIGLAYWYINCVIHAKRKF